MHAGPHARDGPAGRPVRAPQTPELKQFLSALAENREEWREGVCGLGAPVFDARGEPVAAVGISVPSIRFARVHRRELAEAWSAAPGNAPPPSASFSRRPQTRAGT
jgi:IclR family KDG regulon transcriptional repressor